MTYYNTLNKENVNPKFKVYTFNFAWFKENPPISSFFD